MEESKIILGNCLDKLKDLENESIDLTFTSPPYYNAKEYSQYDDYESYLTFLWKVFLAVERVTKEGRFLVINTSPVIEPRESRAHQSHRLGIPFDIHHFLTQHGWDFIDDIIWQKPEPSVKNRNATFSQNRKPLSYKPNVVTEYIMVYRKSTDKLIDWNLKQVPEDVMTKSLVSGCYETTNVWNIAPRSIKAHPAIFPIELAHRIVSYYSVVGDVVLDPFAGSGTVGQACQHLDRKYVLIEQNEKYFDYMQSILGGLKL